MIRYTFGKVTRPTWSVCSVIVQLRSVLYKYTVYVKWRPRTCDLRVVTWRQKWPEIVVKTSWQARCSTARSRRTCRPTNGIFNSNSNSNSKYLYCLLYIVYRALHTIKEKRELIQLDWHTHKKTDKTQIHKAAGTCRMAHLHVNSLTPGEHNSTWNFYCLCI